MLTPSAILKFSLRDLDREADVSNEESEALALLRRIARENPAGPASAEKGSAA